MGIKNFRVRASKLRGRQSNRWQKGHSSDSNPSFRRHRDAAASSLGLLPIGQSSFDLENKLIAHGKVSSKTTNDVFDDTASDVTAETRISQFTACTNPTFDRVHRQWKSGSPIHQDVVSVLAAVVETIKQAGGQETELEYLAALTTTLIGVKDQPNLVAATAFLLKLVLKKIPVHVLQSKFGQLSDPLYQILTQYATYEENPNLLRYILICLCEILRVQDRQAWHASSTVRMLESIVQFSNHDHPRIRKSAIHGITAIFSHGSISQRGISSISTFCIRSLQEEGAFLRISTLLYGTMHVFGAASIKQISELLLQQCLASNDSVQRTQVFRCFYEMFRRRPTIESMPTPLNTQIIQALYDFRPAAADSKSEIAWIQAICEAQRCLHERDPAVSAPSIPHLLQQLINPLSNCLNSEVVLASIQAICLLLESCFCQENAANCLKVLESTLSFQFGAVWNDVLPIWSKVFEFGSKIGIANLPECEKIWKQIAELREADEIPCRSLLEKLLGSAISNFGPELILKCVPLGLDSPVIPLDFPRSWLLPVLKENIRSASLGFFAEEFLPLAKKLRQHIEFNEKKSPMAVKFYSAMEFQIWDLLGAFCRNPKDLSEAFPPLAPILGKLLADCGQIRGPILAALRILLKNENSHEILQKYAKNYLPILFNLILQEGIFKGERLQTLETVRFYLQISSPAVIQNFLNEAEKKLLETKNFSKEKSKVFIADLVIAMVQSCDSTQLDQIFALAENLVEILPKKSFRIVEEFCAKIEEKEIFLKYLQENLDRVEKFLLQSPIGPPAAKASRLKCLLAILNYLPDGYFRMIFSDVLIGFQEQSVKARNTAAKLFVGICERYVKNSGVDSTVDEIFDELPKNLYNNESLLKGTLIALRLFVYNFRNDLSAEKFGKILAQICPIFQSNEPAFVKLALQFLITAVGALQDVIIGQYLEIFLPAIFGQSEQCLKSCRIFMHRLLAKICGRFGIQVVQRFAPETYQKQLNAIRKRVIREQKKKLGRSETGPKKALSTAGVSAITGLTVFSRPETIGELLQDTDSEAEADDDQMSVGRKSRRNAGSLRLKNNNEDQEVIDLLDPLAVRHLAGPSSSKKVKVSAESEFKMNKEGKLIIGSKIEEEKMEISDVEAEENEDEKDLGKNVGKKRMKNKKISEKFRSNSKKHDVKKNGEPDPFEYLPLEFRSLNKRKQAKSKGRFKHVLEGARKGAKKGGKFKNQIKRR